MGSRQTELFIGRSHPAYWSNNHTKRKAVCRFLLFWTKIVAPDLELVKPKKFSSPMSFNGQAIRFLNGLIMQLLVLVALGISLNPYIKSTFPSSAIAGLTNEIDSQKRNHQHLCRCGISMSNIGCLLVNF